ncbi:metallophosphoesterase family protein [uncultured Desulfovibrio sp.]|uniref:metallophosphoesterase family protein n=1 Tax=uncultured Desulfovibrio sp. TaxID=167968 RepID=UPI0003A2F549|nr:metallophosphoesterase family protein [uncultured Desulfovibrio sp.]
MPSADAQDYLWIAVGDIHDEPACFERIPELAQADGIIVTGDLTITGGVKQAELVMDVLRACALPVWAQIGNMDRPEVDTWLSEQGCNLHTVTRELTPDTAIFGVGASTFTPFGTPSEFPESAFAAWLDACWQRARHYPHTVLVSHNPPKDTACDVIPGDVHVGSTAVREFLEEAQPDICLCGHIHEARAVDRVGRTVVVNPGALAQGGYVVLRSNSGRLSAELRVLENH